MRGRQLRAAAVTLVLAAGPLAACGSGGSAGDGGGAAATSTAAGVAAPVVVSATEAQAVLAKKPVVIDVRTPEEFADGFIAGAKLLDWTSGQFAKEIGSLDRNAAYFVYCRSGNRSARATAMMHDLGFTNVTELGGGILAWESAGLPIER